MRKNSLVIILMALVGIGSFASAEDPYANRLSANAGFMGANTPLGVNMEYWPNANWNVGAGFCPSIPPYLEFHAYARYLPLNGPVSPFTQVSTSFIYPGQFVGVEDWFFCRVEMGAQYRSVIGFYAGIGIGYQIIGSHGTLVLPWDGFFPDAYLGWSVPLSR